MTPNRRSFTAHEYPLLDRAGQAAVDDWLASEGIEKTQTTEVWFDGVEARALCYLPDGKGEPYVGPDDLIATEERVLSSQPPACVPELLDLLAGRLGDS